MGLTQIRLDLERPLVLRLRLLEQIIRSRRVALATGARVEHVSPIIQRLVQVRLDPERRLVLNLRLLEQTLRRRIDRDFVGFVMCLIASDQKRGACDFTLIFCDSPFGDRFENLYRLVITTFEERL